MESNGWGGADDHDIDGVAFLASGEWPMACGCGQWHESMVSMYIPYVPTSTYLSPTTYLGRYLPRVCSYDTARRNMV